MGLRRGLAVVRHLADLQQALDRGRHPRIHRHPDGEERKGGVEGPERPRVAWRTAESAARTTRVIDTLLATHYTAG